MVVSVTMRSHLHVFHVRTYVKAVQWLRVMRPCFGVGAKDECGHSYCIPFVSVSILFLASNSDGTTPILSIAPTTMSELATVDASMIVNVVPFVPSRATLTIAPIEADVVFVEPTPHVLEDVVILVADFAMDKGKLSPVIYVVEVKSKKSLPDSSHASMVEFESWMNSQPHSSEFTKSINQEHATHVKKGSLVLEMVKDKC
ncbi:hypothetical protein V6N13_103586 [Hibiscus sabdariffa]|uniref:Uncharacterized protein n=2 Tax=Hibiscus sabdariffa TaxID=183260 RepID=A0ABR2N7E8_9ROSI